MEPLTNDTEIPLTVPDPENKENTTPPKRKAQITKLNDKYDGARRATVVPSNRTDTILRTRPKTTTTTSSSSSSAATGQTGNNTELVRLRNTLQDKEAQIQTLSRECTTNRAELARLRLIASRAEKAEEKTKELQQKLSKLEAARRATTDEQKSVQRMKKEAETALKRFGELEAAAETAKQAEAEKGKALAEEQEKREALEQKVVQYEADNKRLTSENKLLTIHFNTTSLEAEELRWGLLKEYDSHALALDTAANEVEKVEGLEAGVKAREETIDELNKKVTELEQETEELKNELVDRDDTIEKMTEKLTQGQRELNSLRDAQTEYQNKIQQMQAEMGIKTRALRELAEETERRGQQEKKCCEEADELRREGEKMKEELRNLKEHESELDAALNAERVKASVASRNIESTALEMERVLVENGELRQRLSKAERDVKARDAELEMFKQTDNLRKCGITNGGVEKMLEGKVLSSSFSSSSDITSYITKIETLERQLRLKEEKEKNLKLEKDKTEKELSANAILISELNKKVEQKQKEVEMLTTTMKTQLQQQKISNTSNETSSNNETMTKDAEITRLKMRVNDLLRRLRTVKDNIGNDPEETRRLRVEVQRLVNREKTLVAKAQEQYLKIINQCKEREMAQNKILEQLSSELEDYKRKK